MKKIALLLTIVAITIAIVLGSLWLQPHVLLSQQYLTVVHLPTENFRGLIEIEEDGQGAALDPDARVVHIFVNHDGHARVQDLKRMQHADPSGSSRGEIYRLPSGIELKPYFTGEERPVRFHSWPRDTKHMRTFIGTHQEAEAALLTWIQRNGQMQSGDQQR